MSSESERTTPKLPQRWRETPLASVAETRFSSVDKLTYSSEMPVKLCNYTDVYNNEYITDRVGFMDASATEAEVKRFSLQRGDVIITKDSETPDDIGIASVVDYAIPGLLCGYHLALIRPDKTEVDPTFLAKQLRHHRLARHFGQQANGLTRYGLPVRAVNDAPLWLPELGEQQAIGAVLRTLDDAIAKTEAVIAKLRQVRTGLLHDLLTRGLDGNGQLRDPIAHPEQFVDSPVGRVPKDWSTPRLGVLCCHIGSGVTPRGGQDVYTRSGVLFIRSQNVTFDGLMLDDVAYIPEEIHYGMRRSEAHAHDVLFNITGASIGRCCPMPEGLGLANVNQHVCALRIEGATVSDAKYLASVLSSPIGQRQMHSVLTVGNRQGLNYQQLASFLIPWPKADERKAISSLIHTIEHHVSAEEKEYGKMIMLKSGLMTDLLTGRARVPDTQ